MPAFHLATFEVDATPPVGHPLCGGWIEPVRGVDDPLKLLGVVLLGPGKPVVLAALDWCGLRNGAFRTLRAALAAAAHTVPENVAVHCVHPHNAPFADTGAEALIAAANGPPSLDRAFFGRVVDAAAAAVRKSLIHTAAFTHAGYGAAAVKDVASNRRVIGPDGKVLFTRTSATTSAAARAAPDGMIDPQLRTLAVFAGGMPLAALHFYATHPMSYYGDGRVSADFCGLARQKRHNETGVFQAYFTGCAGNVTAGKYNDGAKANRGILRDRVHAGMTTAWANLARFPVTGWEWTTRPVAFAPRPEPAFAAAAARADLADAKLSAARRNNAAFGLAWRDRIRTPIEASSLSFPGRVKTLHLPGEPFVEYQLLAAKLAGKTPVCVAGYGDGGPGYLPTTAAFAEGGYEPTVCLVADPEPVLTPVMAALLADPEPRK